MQLLAGADALMSLAGHRRQQVWQASALRRPPKLLHDAAVDEEFLELPEAREGEEVVHDYNTVGLTLRSHPLLLLRPALTKLKLSRAVDLKRVPNGGWVRYAGIVTVRQAPETAKGVVFVSLEDETGDVQVIIWPSLKEKQRAEMLRSKLLAVYGRWQRKGGVANLIAQELEDLSSMLGELSTTSRDFH
ncbi:OB-fold nucleic acid binding domain-containing protein [Pseudorhodoferax sp. LjRoot39]|uniref:OB-fold nucleic acid binding domain-containing protein n=1 Tax=Pseudorhodoferax sp. LjRoot39 TaxID=3342328 RepID=UPI003ECE2C66